MTTIVTVRKNGVAAIGADTLVVAGTNRQSACYLRNHSKILRVGDSLIALTGPAGIAMALASHFGKLDAPPQLDSPLAIFEMACELQDVLEGKYHLRPHDEDDDEFNSLRFHALIANPKGIFELTSLRSVLEFDRFVANGNGYRFAVGAMHALYDTDATAEAIARAGLEAAAEFDWMTGLPIEVHVLPLADGA